MISANQTKACNEWNWTMPLVYSRLCKKMWGFAIFQIANQVDQI